MRIVSSLSMLITRKDVNGFSSGISVMAAPDNKNKKVQQVNFFFFCFWLERAREKPWQVLLFKKKNSQKAHIRIPKFRMVLLCLRSSLSIFVILSFVIISSSVYAWSVCLYLCATRARARSEN